MLAFRLPDRTGYIPVYYTQYLTCCDFAFWTGKNCLGINFKFSLTPPMLCIVSALSSPFSALSRQLDSTKMQTYTTPLQILHLAQFM